MAEAEMVAPRSVGMGQPVAGTGLLWLLRGWTARQRASSARGSAESSQDTRALRAHPSAPSTVVASAELVFDRRAAASALAHVLADWRAAERNLDRAVMTSVDRARVEAEVAALRATHHRLFLELQREDRRS